jgi:hypothetical protein
LNNYSKRHSSISIKEFLFFFLILALGIGLRFYRLDYKSLWADEGETFLVAKYAVLSHGHPYLYFEIVGIFLKLIGETEIGLRLLSTIAGVLIIIFAHTLSKSILDKKTAYLQSSILSLSVIGIFSSQNARVYSLTGLGMLISLILFIKGLQSGKWYFWILFATVNSINLMLDHSSGFPLVGYFLFVIFVRKKYKGSLKKFFWSGLITSLLYSVEFTKTYLNLSSMSEGGYSSKFATLTAFPLKFCQLCYYLSTGYFFDPINIEIFKKPFLALFFIISFVFIFIVLIIGFVRFFRRTDICRCIMLTFFVTMFLQIILTGYVSYKFVFPLIMLTIFLSEGFMAFDGLKKWLLFSVYTLIVFINLIHYYTLDSFPSHPENWRVAAQFLRENCGPDDIVYTTGNRNGLFTLRFYLKNTNLQTACRTSEVELLSDYDYPRTKHFDLRTILDDHIQKHKNLWVLFEDWGAIAHRETLKKMLKDYSESKFERSFGCGLKLFLFKNRNCNVE